MVLALPAWFRGQTKQKQPNGGYSNDSSAWMQNPRIQINKNANKAAHRTLEAKALANRQRRNQNQQRENALANRKSAIRREQNQLKEKFINKAGATQNRNGFLLGSNGKPWELTRSQLDEINQLNNLPKTHFTPLTSMNNVYPVQTSRLGAHYHQKNRRYGTGFEEPGGPNGYTVDPGYYNTKKPAGYRRDI